MSTQARRSALFKGIVAALAAVCGEQAMAVDFQFGDGWKGSWTTSISLGTAVRAGKPSTRLYGAANGALVGLPYGTGANTLDEGNLNYSAGDPYSSPFKIISEVSVQKGDMGAFVRAKAWYDITLKNADVNYGNQPNGYNNYNIATDSLGAKKPLSDKGFDTLSKFSGVYLLDAYIYDTFSVGGQPLQVRLGNQVVNWGESLFIQGINQTAPIDVPSFRKPGVELKEVFLPVPMVYFNQSLGDAGSLEAFYQFKWIATPVDAGCGNYWSASDGSISARPGSCNYAVTIAPAPTYPQDQPFGGASGLYYPYVDGKKGSNGGQFGLAYHISVASLADTEFGVYAQRLNSRTPVLNVQYGNYTGMGSYSPAAASWNYPNGIKLLGLSAATNLFGWSISAELSQQIGVPAQISGVDLLYSSLFAPQGLSVGPLGSRALAAYSGNGFLQGWSRANKSQFQVNGIKVGSHLLGSDQYLFVAEAGFQTNNLPDYRDDPTALRYGRNFIFGAGSSPTYAILGLPGGNTCGSLTVSAEGCINDGYVTHFAWGYRLKLDLTYNGVFGTGVTAIPSVFFAQDVQGVSLDSQFGEGHKTLGLSSKFVYDKRYSVEVGTVFYDRTAQYDLYRDRGYWFANFNVQF
ncbi:MAG: DUF1302 domain-containing protein [Rudaea sp.]|uniref:DUF1302 domain-containing protein n=1 Tax=Rudaea sp. TaxID=2136325 RepID=UPI0039E68CA8